MQVARSVVRDMTCLQVALSQYQSDYEGIIPLSFSELYQDKSAATPLWPLTLAKVEKKYRYLPPTQEPPAKETLLIYERKPSWHFHTLREGEFRVYAIGIDKEEAPIFLLIRAPKERCGGVLRKVFF